MSSTIASPPYAHGGSRPGKLAARDRWPPGTLEATIVRLLQAVNRPGSHGAVRRLRAARGMGPLVTLWERGAAGLAYARQAAERHAASRCPGVAPSRAHGVPCVRCFALSPGHALRCSPLVRVPPQH